MRLSYLSVLAMLPLVFAGAQYAHASSAPDFLIDTSFFKYGDPLQYTINLHHQPASTDWFRFRFINNDTRMASDWSSIPLLDHIVNEAIIVEGQPFDKKGSYMLQTDFRSATTLGGGLYEIQLLDDPNQTPKGSSHLLSPREQLRVQYVDSDIKCKPGLTLEQRNRAGATVCVHPDNKSELLKRGFLHDPAKDPNGLIFDKLRSVYDESEPVNFVVWYKGEASSCFYPKVRITNDLGQSAWANDPNDTPCGLDAKKDVNTSYGINERYFDHPVLSAGKYTITAEFEGQKISKDIVVNKPY